MNYYALFYHVVDAYIARRAQFREAHLQLARESHRRGELLLAGAFADPADSALLVFRVTDASIIEAFVRQDPYVVNGLVQRWEIRPWTVVVSNEETG
jgi:uncharacterized protein YciI